MFGRARVPVKPIITQDNTTPHQWHNSTMRHLCQVQFSPKDFADYISKITVTELPPDTLPFTPFHRAVIRGDTDYVRTVLSNISTQKKHMLLNARINYNIKCDLYNDEKQDFCGDISVFKSYYLHSNQSTAFQLCIVFAFCSGNREMVDELLVSGADITMTDSKRNNCLHLLVTLSDTNPRLATDMYTYLVSEKLSVKQIKDIMFKENCDGLIPLEMASTKCLPEMMLAIMETQGVYKRLVKDYGMCRYVCYDITDYTCSGDIRRRKNNILRFLTYCTGPQLNRLKDSRLLSSEPFRYWYERMETNFRLCKYFYLCFFLIFILLFAVCNIMVAAFHQTPPECFLYILLVMALIVLIGECAYLGTNLYTGELQRYCRLLEGYKTPEVHGNRYRIFHILFSTGMIILFTVHSEQFDCGRTMIKTYSIVYVYSIFMAMFCLMFFSLLNNSTGHFMTMIQKMEGDMVAFSTVYFWVYLGITASFHMLHININCMNGTYGHGNQTETQPFSTFAGSLYDTLILVLGIASPKYFYFENTAFPTMSMLLYVASLITSGLLLLNLLIGIMNERVIEITGQKEILLTLQKLSIYFFLEDLLKLPFSMFFWVQYFTKGRFVIELNGFIQDKVNGRVHVPVIENTLIKGK